MPEKDGQLIVADSLRLGELVRPELPTRAFCSNLSAGVILVWRVPFDCTIRAIACTATTMIVSRTAAVGIPVNPDVGEFIAVIGNAAVLHLVNVPVTTTDRIYFYPSASAGHVVWYVTADTGL